LDEGSVLSPVLKAIHDALNPLGIERVDLLEYVIRRHVRPPLIIAFSRERGVVGYGTLPKPNENSVVCIAPKAARMPAR